MVALSQTGSVRDFPAYLHFTPRPDQPERFDEQTAFYESKSDGVSWLIGGNGAGCLAAEQAIYDPVEGRDRVVSEISSGFHVIARNASGNAVVAKAEQPRIYGTEDLYEITLSNGQIFRATLGHRLLTAQGWREIGDIVRDDDQLRHQFAQRSQEAHDASGGVTPCGGHTSSVERSDKSTAHLPAMYQADQTAKASFVLPLCLILSGETNSKPAYITSVRFLRRDSYWDFHVPEYENYWMAGVWNHNTTTTLLAKVARFVYETPPPRKDTPFWVIAKSYDQVTKTCWKEKLYGQGHILDKDVDWARVGWYKSKQRLPYSVPLTADAKGNNWMLEFRSYEQGIGAMMAQAIGGFAFVEQFPWGVFEEVLRGCREYNFPGSKLVEYTPVDPDLSIDIEEMLENGPEPESGKQPGLRYLPKNWKIYRANTMCAMEAGHVDKKWFEEFFGMVPEDMIDVRMKGLFASFEGVIYKGFNVATHCMGDEMWARIKHCYHRRGIDWGAGPENDFVCLWGARNSIGQWFIYDEIACHDQTKTTVDHLSDVYEQWEWPSDDKMYGPSYCDPSSPDNLRIGMKLNLYNPKVENLSMMRGRNSVIEGIEHIQYLLKPQIPVPVVDAKGMPVIDPETGKVKIKLEPKLFIHRTNCPKLVQQMKTYRWLRGTNKNARTALNPRDAAPEPLKKADHSCFAAETPVLMDDGTSKPICEVIAGDYVLSHRGVTRVVAAGMTGIKEVVAIRGITGIIRHTVDHPWYDMASDHYCPFNEVVSLCRLSNIETALETLSRLSTGTVTHGDDIQSPDTSQCVSTSEELRDHQTENCNTSGCTRKSGSKSTKTSQQGMTFTTSTRTPQITQSTTCSACRKVITQPCTSTTCTRRSKPQNLGTAAKRAERGTDSTQGRLPMLNHCESEHASSAELSTKQLPIEPALSIAQSTVEQTQEELAASTMSRDHALCVGICFPSINTRRSLPVLLPVSPFECHSLPRSEESVNVYNLATEDGTFFVDGILTSNCDALRYLCFSDDFMTGSTISSAKAHSAITTQLSGEYLPDSGRLKGFTTRHRERG